ncbi:hypothetical protein J437_LFUL008809, partial [Ladona fulva]
MIGGKLEKGVKCTSGLPIPHSLQLLDTLNMIAKESYQYVAGKMLGNSQATMSRVANRVFLAFAEELMNAMAAFYKIEKFARVSGCIERAHIRVKYSGGPDVATFLNRKTYCSLNIQ